MTTRMRGRNTHTAMTVAFELRHTDERVVLLLHSSDDPMSWVTRILALGATPEEMRERLEVVQHGEVVWPA